MKQITRTALCLLACWVLAACSTVTIRPKGSAKLSSQPTYESSKPFYLLGIIGQEDINVKSVCGGKPVKQMQTQATFLDGLLGTVTIGIYTPRTVKIWCGGKS